MFPNNNDHFHSEKHSLFNRATITWLAFVFQCIRPFAGQLQPCQNSIHHHLQYFSITRSVEIFWPQDSSCAISVWCTVKVFKCYSALLLNILLEGMENLQPFRRPPSNLSPTTVPYVMGFIWAGGKKYFGSSRWKDHMICLYLWRCVWKSSEAARAVVLKLF